MACPYTRGALLAMGRYRMYRGSRSVATGREHRVNGGHGCLQLRLGESLISYPDNPRRLDGCHECYDSNDHHDLPVWQE